MTTLAAHRATFNNRPAPLDCRPAGDAPIAQLAREFKVAVNSSISVEDLIGLGEPRLRQLVGGLSPEARAQAQRVLAGNDAPVAAPTRAALLTPAADPYDGYSLNKIADHVIGTTEGDLLRLATDVQTLIRGASGEKLIGLGEAQLKALKAHFEQA